MAAWITRPDSNIDENLDGFVPMISSIMKNADQSISNVYFILGDVAEVAQLHRRLGPIDAPRQVLNGGAVFEDRINLVVLESVRQLAEHDEDIAEAMRQGGVDLVLDGPRVAQAKDLGRCRGPRQCAEYDPCAVRAATDSKACRY
jgi:hypothetical protein